MFKGVRVFSFLCVKSCLCVIRTVPPHAGRQRPLKDMRPDLSVVFVGGLQQGRRLLFNPTFLLQCTMKCTGNTLGVNAVLVSRMFRVFAEVLNVTKLSFLLMYVMRHLTSHVICTKHSRGFSEELMPCLQVISCFVHRGWWLSRL